jgi:hypothetical protein
MNNLKILSFCLFVICLSSCKNPGTAWIDLLENKDLQNWKAVRNPDAFRFEEGSLVCSGANGFLMAEAAGKFRNFIVEAEIKTSPGAFSSLLFHTSGLHTGSVPAGYQVVIGNSPRQMTEKGMSMKTGSIFGIRHVYFQMVPDNEWYTLKIQVNGNCVQTFVNGTKVVEYIQPERPWRGKGNENRIFTKGYFGIETFAGTTYFRAFKVMTQPSAAITGLKTPKEWDTEVTQLAEQCFPLIDFHVHLKGGLTIDQAIQNSQKLGINYGIAPNCGLKFPVTDDKSLFAYMDTVVGKPIFRGMQAEGREWVTLFSPEAVAKFDYVFTDALTFTDAQGRRNRLWIPAETWVDDKQEFMEQLVSKIEAIFSQEPVNIYVNPTLLPPALMPEYDQLWTPDRIARVIKVLKENNITLEINARYKVPHAVLIKEAKKAGLKFSFGTNNAAAELGQLEYCLQMLEECALTPEDMFLPPLHEQKPVLIKGLPAKITG